MQTLKQQHEVRIRESEKLKIINEERVKNAKEKNEVEILRKKKVFFN